MRKAPKQKSLIEAGDSVMLGSPLTDPVHWFIGKVLWTDGIEVLVEQYGYGGNSPHKQIHGLDYVRTFGTIEHCANVKRLAEKVVRDAARQCQEVEEMAADLRRKLIDLFETVAGQALKASKESLALSAAVPSPSSQEKE